MKLNRETAQIQEQLGEFCRTGREGVIPGVTPGRLNHYRRLVSNVVKDVLDSGFPISKAALGEEQWDRMVQDFFAYGEPKAPQVWRLPYEFYQYHASQETGSRIGKAFLDDLLYFEWMEIEVFNMPDRSFPEYVTQGDILDDKLAFNPEYEIIRMTYPVHLFSAEDSLEHKGNYFVLIFRSPDTGYVKFLNLSALNVYILTRLVEEDVPLGHLRGEIAQSTGIESAKYMDESLENIIGELMEKQLVLGFKKQ